MFQEKRSSVRQNKNAAVHVDVISNTNHSDEPVRYEGSTKDISQQGIRLHGKHPIEKGQLVELMVELEADHSQFRLKGDVKWVTETTESEYIAGLKLLDSSSDFAKWQAVFG